MSQLWTTPLGPVIFLTAAAMLMMTINRRIPARWRHSLWLGITGLTLLLWLLLRWLSPQMLWEWVWRAPLSLNATLSLQLSGWAWLSGAAILLVGLSSLLTTEWPHRPGFLDSRFWLAMAMATGLVLVLAASWVVLLLAWTILLFVTGLLAGRQAAAVWTMAILSSFLLLGSALFNGGATLEMPLAAGSLNAQAQLLIALAVALALGIYPLHRWLISEPPRSHGQQLVVHLIPSLAALYVLGRFDLSLLASQSWALLGVLALLGSALIAWSDVADQHGWEYLLINRASWALLALSLTRLPAPGSVLLPQLALLLGSCLWIVSQHHRRLRYLAMAVLFAVPLTPGFATTFSLSQLATSIVGLPVWLIMLLAQAIFLAALLRHSQRQERTVGASGRAQTLLATLLGIVVLWWGLFPGAAFRLAGLETGDGLAHSLQIWRSTGWLDWLTFLLPLGGGLLMWRADQRLFAQARTWQVRLASFTSLRWLYAGVGRVLQAIVSSLGMAADLIDGAGQFGWVLLAALLTWFMFFR